MAIPCVLFHWLFSQANAILFHMNRRIDYPIGEADSGQTIEYFLRQQGYTHSILVLLKRTQEGILLNGIWARTSDRLYGGDLLTVSIEEPHQSSDILPSAVMPAIAYEDEDIIILDKPAHMPIHPSLNHYENTLANALMSYFSGKGEYFTFRCVNRLDRGTTGLTIVAKHILSAVVLNRQITERRIHRTYLAICEGCTEESGTITAPIARKEASTVERCVDFKNGESAITHYRRLAYRADLHLSLVQLQLETGRTHQIRVHMSYIGHPLIGDFLYNANYTHISRQALHSASLEFEHPVTHQKMHLTSDLPSDMKCLFPSY